jgi:glycosyltransferase involved in cell wall biosynthesis
MPAPIPVLLMTRELNLGGSERQLAEIAKALDRTRFDPRVGCFRAGGLRSEELRAAGVPVVHFPVPTAASIRGALRIVTYIREQGIRLVHTFDTPANVYGVPSARMAGTPVVLSSQRAHRSLASPLNRRALRVTDRLVDAVVVNCEFVRRHLINDEKIPVGLIRLCYNGIDTRVFHPVRGARPEPLRAAPLVIGTVSALRPEKGLEALLEAFAQLRAALYGLKLAIIGSGPCLSDLQVRAQSLGILPDCVFQPATPHVASWLAAIDIFVLPSLSEALSNSLMEAMACGCAVIATRVGGNPELVVHGETGMLFETRDNVGLASLLRQLAGSPDLRAMLAANAVHLIRQHFSIESSARRMEDIYSESGVTPY